MAAGNVFPTMADRRSWNSVSPRRVDFDPSSDRDIQERAEVGSSRTMGKAHEPKKDRGYWAFDDSIWLSKWATDYVIVLKPPVTIVAVDHFHKLSAAMKDMSGA